MPITPLPQFEIEGAAIDTHGNISGRVVLTHIPEAPSKYRDLRVHFRGSSDHSMDFFDVPQDSDTNPVLQVSVEQTLHPGRFGAGTIFPSCWPFRLALSSKRRTQWRDFEGNYTVWPCIDDAEDLYYSSGLSPCIPPSCSAELLWYDAGKTSIRVYYHLFASVDVQVDGPYYRRVTVSSSRTLLFPAHVPTPEQLVKMQKSVSEEQLHTLDRLPIVFDSAMSASNAARVEQGAFNYWIELKTLHVHHQSEVLRCEIAIKPQCSRGRERDLALRKLAPVHLRTASLTLCGEFAWRWQLPSDEDMSIEHGRWNEQGVVTSYKDEQVVKYDNLNLSEQEKQRHTIDFRFDHTKTICSFATMNLRHKNFLNCTIETECGGQVHTTEKRLDIVLVGAKGSSWLPTLIPPETARSDLDMGKPRGIQPSSVDNFELSLASRARPSLCSRQFVQYRRFQEFLQKHPPEEEWQCPTDPQFALYLQFLRFQDWRQGQESQLAGPSDAPPPYSDNDGASGATGESGKRKM